METSSWATARARGCDVSEIRGAACLMLRVPKLSVVRGLLRSLRRVGSCCRSLPPVLSSGFPVAVGSKLLMAWPKLPFLWCSVLSFQGSSWVRGAPGCCGSPPSCSARRSTDCRQPPGPGSEPWRAPPQRRTWMETPVGSVRVRQNTVAASAGGRGQGAGTGVKEALAPQGAPAPWSCCGTRWGLSSGGRHSGASVPAAVFCPWILHYVKHGQWRRRVRGDALPGACLLETWGLHPKQNPRRRGLVVGGPAVPGARRALEQTQRLSQLENAFAAWRYCPKRPLASASPRALALGGGPLGDAAQGLAAAARAAERGARHWPPVPQKALASAATCPFALAGSWLRLRVQEVGWAGEGWEQTPQPRCFAPAPAPPQAGPRAPRSRCPGWAHASPRDLLQLSRSAARAWKLHWDGHVPVPPPPTDLRCFSSPRFFPPASAPPVRTPDPPRLPSPAARAGPGSGQGPVPPCASPAPSQGCAGPWRRGRPGFAVLPCSS